MKKYTFILALLIMMTWSAAATEIVETVEVKGQLFSDELNSKNMVIISDHDLEQLKIKDITGLFSFFTALNVSKRGPGESSFDIAMRGGNFEQVLVMVNGIPMNNPQTGHFNGDFPFSVHDIQRVEIIRGGTSTTYGSGAFAGVVHFVLKKDTGFKFNVTTGEKKYFSASVQGGKQFKHLALRFSVDRNTSSGFYEGREFEQTRFTAGASYKRKNTTLDLFAGYLNKDFGAQGFYAPFPSFEKIKSYFYQAQWTQTFKHFDYSLVYAYNKHDDDFTLDRYRPSFYHNQSDTTLNHLRLFARYRGKKMTASAGAEYKKETMDSTSMGERNRSRGALFLNINYLWSKNSGFDAGIRRNFEPGQGSNFTSNFTFYTGLYHRIAKDMTLRAGYGKSTRLPSFTELYYNSPSNKGSEQLKPEISHNYEISLSYLKGKYNLDVSLFYRDQQNVIDWMKINGTGPWFAANIEKNDIVGAEITQALTLDRTRLTLGIERLTVVNNRLDNNVQSKYGLRFPDVSVKFNIMQSIGKHLKAAINYNYKRIYKADQQGHFLNLVVSYSLGRAEISLRADNIFEDIIEEIPGLKVPGRWVYVTLSYR